MTTLLVDIDEVLYKICFRHEKKIYSILNTRLKRKLPVEFEYKKDAVEYMGDDPDGILDLVFEMEIGTLDQCKQSLNEYVEWLREAARADDVLFCYGSGLNFREAVATILPYKGNRPSTKPVMFNHLLAYIKEAHYVHEMDGIETDDVLGIMQTKAPEGTTIILSQVKYGQWSSLDIFAN